MVSAAPNVQRKSRMARRRAAVLITVHLLMIAHVIHWLLAGRTLSPVEPSEAMYTLDRGYLNAGFIFFATAIVATLIFGRFFCGWGCHFVAYQDLCAWLLRRVGIRPRPLRARLLVLAPLALALYMFVWPSAYRWATGTPRAAMSNHLFTADFWQTFPGPIIAVLTVLVAGFAIVYFLGSKGFCTYACPYGAFFAPADRLATGRIRVTDDCKHCGHCTAACSSNVRVHDEVKRFGMVVDPGCMKCMDCVSVCPNDALYYGFARPSVAARPASAPKRRTFDFTLGEELVMAAVGLATLLALRGLYDLVPLLFAMGLAAMTAVVVLKLYRLARDANVRWQNFSLKRGRRWTGPGVAFAALSFAWMVVVAHSGFVQWASWQGKRGAAALALGDDIWQPGTAWTERADEEQRATAATAIRQLQRADRWSLLPTPSILQDMLWLHVARNNLDAAEGVLHRLIASRPHDAEPQRALGNLHRKSGRLAEAEQAFRAALTLDPQNRAARDDLIALLLQAGNLDDALREARLAADEVGTTTNARLRPARILMQAGRFLDARRELARLVQEEPNRSEIHLLLGIVQANLGEQGQALDSMRRAVRLDPDQSDARYNLGMILLARGAVNEAVNELTQAARLDPARPIYHYNLAVANFMNGRPDLALPAIQEALRLNPDDADARAFLDVVKSHLAASTASDTP